MTNGFLVVIDIEMELIFKIEKWDEVFKFKKMRYVIYEQPHGRNFVFVHSLQKLWNKVFEVRIEVINDAYAMVLIFLTNFEWLKVFILTSLPKITKAHTKWILKTNSWPPLLPLLKSLYQMLQLKTRTVCKGEISIFI